LGKINPLKSSENLPSISYRIEKNEKRFQIVDVNHCAILRQITFVPNKTINVLFLFIHMAVFDHWANKKSIKIF